jgi:2-amino-4-hydroxy-6-hydroxymethyldihydropteridine diphosphokinase
MADAPPPGQALAFIGLGANLGDAASAVRAACDALARVPGTQLLQCSPLYRSAPVDAGGPDYVNAVAQVQTTLPALELLHALQSIEQAAGRERPYRNAPRTLDLDLLIYADLKLNTPELTLPHPRMAERAFVLRPLQDIAPDRVPAAALAAVAGQRITRL